jgi:CubicO group peptidase (beta-lactamase class C family)
MNLAATPRPGPVTRRLAWQSLLVVLAWPGLAGAQARADSDSARASRIAEAVSRLEAFDISGQVLVAEHGRILFERAVGWADRRYGAPMTDDTRLGIGSVTKSFVAAALVKLEARGRLALTDRLGDHLAGVPADKAGVTLEQLLTHTSGLPFHIPDGLDRAPRDSVVAAILGEPLEFEVGERFGYSNAGYDLLAAVIEHVTHEPFATWVRRELLDPAGATASGIAGSPDLPGGPAATGTNEWKEVADWREWPHGWSGTGSGRMVSNARDLWRWCESLRSGRVVGAEGWSRMARTRVATRDSGGYGLGLWTARRGGRTIQVLGGDVDGYHAECRIDSADDRVTVVLTNQEPYGTGAQCRRVLDVLGRIARGGAPELPPATAPLGEFRTAIEGEWATPGAGRIEIWRENGRLRLGALGQDAIERFESGDPEAVRLRRTVAGRADSIVSAVVRRDTLALHALLPEDSYAFAVPFLRDHVRLLEVLHDDVVAVHALGAVTLPWSPGSSRADVRLQFARRSEDLTLGWDGERLSDVSFGENRPFPVLLPVAPLAGGGWASYDLLRGRAVTFRAERDVQGRMRLRFGPPDDTRDPVQVR